MKHWDNVLPGKIHRVNYESMISDTENEIKKLIKYCDLDFEDACLNFYENKRTVRTPSSEQVRQPIYTSGMSQWKNFEEWLTPLKNELILE